MIDVLGHPITVGATAITNGYCTSTLNTITVVEKVTKKAAYVTVEAFSYNWETRERYRTKKLMRKRPDQIMIIEKQLNYNKKTYPENFI